MTSANPIIQPLPPNDGKEYDCQCGRCGSSCDSDACETCGGDGWIFADYWDDDEDVEDECRKCHDCFGNSVTYRCMSSREWCEKNPMPGREDVKRGQIEWFRINTAKEAT